MGSANTAVIETKKQYTGTAARLLKLLGTGISQTEAAAAVGVTDSFVSQLMGEADFSSQVEALVSQAAVDSVEIDQNYVEIEKVAVERLKTNMAFITSTDQLLRVIKVTNEAKKKVLGSEVRKEQGAVLHPVKISLPGCIINNYIVNPQNEVVSIGGREMVTLNSSSMANLVQKAREQPQLVESVNTKIEEIPRGKSKQLTAEDFNNL